MKRAIIIMSSIMSLFSCAQPGQSEARIAKFSYHFDGTIGGNSHTYEVTVTDSAATVMVEDMLHYDYGEMTDTVGADFVQTLENLCRKHNVKKFDGFDKTNPYVSDGQASSLYIRYDNGTTVDFYGRNMSPKGWHEFSEEMHGLFRPVCERLCEAALQKKMAQGVSGDLTFIMMNFIQQGESGSDRYKVMISRSGIRQKNFEVRVRSGSGEFFPQGEYSIYKSVPDDAIDWKAFAGLVKKHNLVQWMDYDKAAKDYNNSEWFQLDWSFEDGHISASGTEHPENYDAFRKDFLAILRKAVDKVSD